ncbi:MAG TPA: trigger factor [Candidatus Paceibacterota bacterium]|nr:trigger factor [Candidatus Paceibacterota bacterium]
MDTITIQNLEKSRIEITGELPAEELEKHRSQAIKDLGKDAEFDGFRKGHVPEKILVEKIGEDRVLLEMAELALAQAYPRIIVEKKLEAIGRPEITLTKLAKGNPLGFKIVTAVLPEVKLPKDYAKLAGAAIAGIDESVEATDEEAVQMIDTIRKNRAIKVEGQDEPQLPELTDEFAKSLGQFESVDDLKSKVKENIALEKAGRLKEKRRLKAVEAIGEKTEIVIPDIMIESETEKMLGEMRFQIEQMGLTFDDYLKHIQKTEAALKADWQDDAAKRVRFGLIMDAIAKTEKIEAPEEELKKEVEHLMSHHQHADPMRISSYAEHLIINEKVFQFLENQK